MNLKPLSPRERWMVAAAVLTVLVVGAWLGILSPYREKMSQLEAKMVSRQRQLRELRELESQYARLKAQMAMAERRLEGKGKSFSLFSFVEATTESQGIRDNLVSLRPHKVPAQGEFNEESVEVKLDRVSLEQLVRLLYALESAEAFLQVKTLKVKSRFDDSSLLDTVLTITHYTKAS